jgi:hypothetical protein
MNLLDRFFSNSKIILPVIHIKTMNQSLCNAIIAYEQGCDGIFLINHGESSHIDLIKIHNGLYERFPDWWIGINCLDLAPVDVFNKVTQKVSGVWTDNAMINENSEVQPEADLIQVARKKSNWQGLYFGGVAFKYQRSVNELAKAVRIAVNYMDVVTTSGPATGEPANIGKITEMKQAIGNAPLAIASGITSRNINDYLKIANCFLVATGISKSFWELDALLVKELVYKIRNYKH